MVNLYRMYDRWDYMNEYETVFVREGVVGRKDSAL
jgi:hypothetical protein